MVCTSILALMSLLIALPSETIADRINNVFGSREGTLPDRKGQLREIIDEIRIPLESLPSGDLTAVAAALEALEEYGRCYNCCKALSLREPDSSSNLLRLLRAGLQVESAGVLEKDFSVWDADSGPLAEANCGFLILSYAYLKSNDRPSAWRMVEGYCNYIVRLFDSSRPQALKLAAGVIPYCGILVDCGGGEPGDVESLAVLYDRVGGELMRMGNRILSNENGPQLLALQRDLAGLLQPEQHLTLICRQLETIASFGDIDAARRSEALAQGIQPLMANAAALGTGKEDLEYIQNIVRSNHGFTDAHHASLQPRFKAASLLKSRVFDESATRPVSWLIVANGQAEVSEVLRHMKISSSALPGVCILVSDRTDTTVFPQGVEVLDLKSPGMAHTGAANARRVSEELSHPLFLCTSEEGLVKAVCLSYFEAIAASKRMVPRISERTPKPD